MNCTCCRADLVPSNDWDQMPADERKARRERGQARGVLSRGPCCACAKRGGRPARQLRALTTTWAIEDVEWMARGGESRQGAAQRLGMTADALERLLRLQQRTDLLHTLRRRDPLSLRDNGKRWSA